MPQRRANIALIILKIVYRGDHVPASWGKDAAYAVGQTTDFARKICVENEIDDKILSTVRAEVIRWRRKITKPSHIYMGRFALPLNPKFWIQRRMSEFVCRQTAKVGDLR